MTLNNINCLFDNEKSLSFSKKAYLWVIGFLFCQNIIVPIKIGSTPFNLSIFLVLFFIIYKIVVLRRQFFLFFKRIPVAFYLYLVTILFSIIPGLFMISKVKDISPLFKGIIFYFLTAILPMLIGLITDREEKKNIFFGLLIGFIMNTIISIVVYLIFNIFGYTLTFTSLFRNDSFFEPNYFSSAQGLFLEPSHLAGFYLMSFYLLFWFYKNKLIRIVLFISSWIVFIMYNLGNLPIFIVSQIVFILILYGKTFLTSLKKKVFISIKRKLIFFTSMMLIIIVCILLFAFPMRSLFEKIFYEFNPFSEANHDRFNSIVVGLNVFVKNPLGVGFNLSGGAIEAYYGDAVTTATTHSFLLKILIEQGIFGIITFIYLIYTLVSVGIKRTNCSCITISLVCSILFSFLNGPTEPYLFFLIGIFFSLGQFNTSFYFWKKEIKLNDILFAKIDI